MLVVIVLPKIEPTSRLGALTGTGAVILLPVELGTDAEIAPKREPKTGGALACFMFSLLQLVLNCFVNKLPLGANSALTDSIAPICFNTCDIEYDSVGGLRKREKSIEQCKIRKK